MRLRIMSLRNAIDCARFGLYRAAWSEVMDAAARRLAWALPRRLVKWCFYRVLVHATTGEYADTVVPELTAMETAARWIGTFEPPPETVFASKH